jgi:hypothetical protein
MRLTRAASFLGYTLEGDRYLPRTAGCNEVDASSLLFGVTHLKENHYLPRRPSEEAPMHQGSGVVLALSNITAKRCRPSEESSMR